MSEKRTKADKAQRQTDRLENKESRRPAQNRQKRNRPGRTSARLLWVVAVLRRDHAFVGRFSSSAIHSNSSLTTGLSGKALAVSMAFASSGVSLVKCGALYFFLRPDSESGVDVLGSDGSFRMALWSVLNNYSLWTAREPRL